MMAIKFSDDPIGCILEYFFLWKHRDKSSQDEWTTLNGSPKRNQRSVVVVDPNDPFFGDNEGSRSGLEYQLKASGQATDETARQLIRIFRKLESEYLIEPHATLGSISMDTHQITLIGEELYSRRSYNEFINGFKYIAEKWKKSACRIYAQGGVGIGSGFLISNNQVATARHVLEDLKTKNSVNESDLRVQFESGDEYVIGDVCYPKGVAAEMFDLVIIELAARVNDKIPFRIENEPPDMLDPVLVLGYPPIPQTLDPYCVAYKGEVASVIKSVDYGRGTDAFIVSSLLRGGCSGGPVLNREGSVVGVVSMNLISKLSEQEVDIIQGIGYSCAVPAYWLNDLLRGEL